MFKVTMRGLVAHKVRLLATAVSVLLGVAFVAGTLVLTDTVGRSFDDLYATIYENTDVQVRAAEKVDGQGGAPAERGPVPAATLDAVLAVPGVAAAEGELAGYAQLVDRDGEAMGNPGQGAPTLGFDWPDIAELNPFELVEGAPPAGAGDVVIDKASATKGGYGVGDPITVLTQAGPQQMTVRGVVRFGGVDSPLGASIALFDAATAERLIGQPGTYGTVGVVADDGVSQDDLAARLRDALPGGTEAITGEALTAEQQSETRAGLAFFTTFLLVFAGIALFVGSFIIFNTFSIVVAQRTKELALLRALGANRRQVRTAVVLEAALVGLVASAVGVVAGIGVAAGLSGLLAAAGIDVPGGGTVLLPRTVVVGLVVGVVVTVVSALVPAWKAARVPPVAAMRDVSVDRSGTSLARAAAGTVVAGAGAAALALGLFGDTDNGLSLVGLGALGVFLGVAVLGPVLAKPIASVLGSPLPALRGVAGRLARANATRNPRRTSATASALMVGVGLVAAITILATSARESIDDVIDRSFAGDFVIESGAFTSGGLAPALADDLRATPGVEQVSSLRFEQVGVDGGSTFLPAIDVREASTLADVEPLQGSLDDLGVGTVAVSDEYAAEHGLALGDTVAVTFSDTGTHDLRVATVYGNQALAGPLFVSTEAQEAYSGNRLDATLYVGLVDGADVAATRAAVEATAAPYANAEVQDLTEFKAAQSEPIDQMLGLVYGLLLLAVVIALIGIANTLALSVFERTHELGLLRAVGMTRRQVRSAVRWESVVIALFGTALGIGIGVLFGWALVRALERDGLTVLVVPVGSLVVIAVLAALAGVVAAIGPARRAARLDVLSAISTA